MWRKKLLLSIVDFEIEKKLCTVFHDRDNSSMLKMNSTCNMLISKFNNNIYHLSMRTWITIKANVWLWITIKTNAWTKSPYVDDTNHLESIHLDKYLPRRFPSLPSISDTSQARQIWACGKVSGDIERNVRLLWNAQLPLRFHGGRHCNLAVCERCKFHALRWLHPW